MFLVTEVPADGPQLERYRTELLKVFSPYEFKMFVDDHLNEKLENEVGLDGPGKKVMYEALGNFARAGTLKKLLVDAIRYRARNLPFVRKLAEPLGLRELVELADGLATRQCKVSLREQAIGDSVDLAARELRAQTHADGVESWIDALVWLDELSTIPGKTPRLALCLQRLHGLWSAEDPENAAYLQTWLDQNGISTAPLPADDVRALRGVLVELEDAGGTQCAVTAYAFANDRARPVKLVAHTFASTEKELSAGLASVVDECISQPLVSGWLSKGNPFRFEFLLPKAWLALPVDQLLIAGDEDNDAVSIGASYPVLLRPRTWCRPKKEAVRIEIARRLEQRRKALREGGGRVEIISPDTIADPGFVDSARNDPSLAALIVPFDVSAKPRQGASRSVLDECLQTHVLAVLWLRKDPDAKLTAEVLTQYLKSIVAPVDEAPSGVLKARQCNIDPGSSVRDRLSLIWHFEPVVLPDDSFRNPEIASQVGGP